jgi:RHS repeat-associated protein
VALAAQARHDLWQAMQQRVSSSLSARPARCCWRATRPASSRTDIWTGPPCPKGIVHHFVDFEGDAGIDFLTGYTGQQYDGETGLSDYKGRYYDPIVGRFLSQDPAHDGTNPYRYVGNDPLNRVDPTGLMTSFLGGAANALGSAVSTIGGGLLNYQFPLNGVAASAATSVGALALGSGVFDGVFDWMSRTSGNAALGVRGLRGAVDAAADYQQRTSSGGQLSSQLQFTGPNGRTDLGGRALQFMLTDQQDAFGFGLLKGGLATAEQVYDTTSLVFGGNGAAAGRSNAAFGLGAIDSSSLVSIPAGFERTATDVLAAGISRSTGQRISDYDLEQYERQRGDFTKLQMQIRDAGTMLHPAASARGREAAPFLETAASAAFLTPEFFSAGPARTIPLSGPSLSRNVMGLTSEEAVILRSRLSEIPGARSVRVFGSRTTGAARTGSDLDVAIFGEIDHSDSATLQAVRAAQSYGRQINLGGGRQYPLDINTWASPAEMRQSFLANPNYDPNRGVPVLKKLE